MGFWDWATTAREAVQGGLGTAARDVYNVAKPVGTVLDVAAFPGSAPAGQAITNAVQSKISGDGGGSTPSTPTNQTNQQQTPTQGQVYYNPLGQSMFAQQLLAPLFSQLANQFHSWNQMGQGMTGAGAPGFQYLNPSQQGMARSQAAAMGQGADNVSAALIGAALASPAIDSLQSSMNALAQRALQSYTENLKTNTNQQLATQNIFNANPNLQGQAAAGATVGGGTIKGSVQSQASLPQTGNQQGDMYTVADQQNATYQWDGTQWQKTG